MSWRQFALFALACWSIAACIFLLLNEANAQTCSRVEYHGEYAVQFHDVACYRIVVGGLARE